MSDAYTPTTEEVRDLFDREIGWDGAFDRWHAAEIAAAEQRGKEQGWDEGYQDGHNDGLSDGHPLGNMRDPNENPYRAEQIADQMETRND